MQLTVSGLDDAPTKFTHLFGRYVNGFRPWKHCVQCFVSNKAMAIHPNMRDGVYPLEDRRFYLCGVGKKVSERLYPELARRRTNVHLAVLPKRGSTASITSVYGSTFVIQDAEAIPIQPLPEGFLGLEKQHWRCKNFQFCWQTFNATEADVREHRKVSDERVPEISG